MTDLVRMLIDNLWDSCDISVVTGTEVSSLPMSHTQVYAHSRTGAILPDENHTSVIHFNLQNLALVSGFVLDRHGLSNAATLRLELFDAVDQGGDCIIDTGVMDAVPTKTLGELNWLIDPLVASIFDKWKYRFTCLWFDPDFVKSGRLTIVDPDGREGLHEIDRIYMGQAFEPLINFDWNKAIGWQATNPQHESAGGSVFGKEEVHKRQLAFTFSWISDADAAQMQSDIDLVGLSKDWFISMYPNDGTQKEIQNAMVCKFTGQLPQLTQVFNDNSSAPFALREA